ncbi:MAG TPA: hypothetical protein VFL47_02615, partial [Flavisolibacter sp.]|nr:hypothetical protein [Flavisolibacter sp.]
MKQSKRLIRTAFYFLLFLGVMQRSLAAAPTNDDCASASSLPIGTNCTTTNGDLSNATIGTPASTCGTAYDVWYSIVVPANASSVTINVTT